MQNDVKRILDLYRRHGRFAATVEPKVIQLAENRVDLVFEINEGEFTGVRSINFVGNRAVQRQQAARGDSRPRKAAGTGFSSTDDTYDPDRLTYDRELLRKFYLSEGYADFRVVSAVAELTPDRDGFVVTFTVDEGERYHSARSTSTSSSRICRRRGAAAADRPDAATGTTPMQSRSRSRCSPTRSAIAATPLSRSSRRSPATATTTRSMSPSTSRKGRRSMSSASTSSATCARSTRSSAANSAWSKATPSTPPRCSARKQRIKNLGFFKKVEVTNSPGSAPDKTVITVEVEEQSTGEFSLGVGFSTTDGPLADITIRERNFLGRGQDLRLGTVVSFRSQQVDLSFTEPYFLDRNIAAGFDLFEIKTSPTANFFSGVTPPYQQFSYGGALRAGYQITENLRQTLKYTARPTTSPTSRATPRCSSRCRRGSTLTSESARSCSTTGATTASIRPSGYYASLGNDFAGVGFGVDYVRNKVNAGYYYSVAPDWVLSFTGEAGDIFGWDGQQVLLQDRFFVGGDNLRGFPERRHRPARLVTGDALGGNKYYARLGDLGGAARPAEGTWDQRAGLHRFRHLVATSSRRTSC